jgi:hypothetical protein
MRAVARVAYSRFWRLSSVVRFWLDGRCRRLSGCNLCALASQSTSSGRHATAPNAQAGMGWALGGLVVQPRLHAVGCRSLFQGQQQTAGAGCPAASCPIRPAAYLWCEAPRLPCSPFHGRQGASRSTGHGGPQCRRAQTSKRWHISTWRAASCLAAVYRQLVRLSRCRGSVALVSVKRLQAAGFGAGGVQIPNFRASPIVTRNGVPLQLCLGIDEGLGPGWQ